MQRTFLALILIDLCLLLLLFFLRKKNKPSGLVLSLFIFLFLLLTTELCYRGFVKDKPAGIKVYPNNFFNRDPDLGYKHSTAGVYRSVRAYNENDTIFDVRYTIMSDTANDGITFNHRKGFYNSPAAHNYIFTGCSFTFGEGVNDTETLPWIFGSKSGNNTINLGCNGFGIHQVFYLMKNKLAKANNANKTVIYSFRPDHIYRAFGAYDWNAAGPYYQFKNDTITHRSDLSSFRQSSDPTWIYYVSARGALTFIRDPLKKMVLANKIRSIDSIDYPLGLKMITEMSDAIVKTGGRMIFLYWDLDGKQYSPSSSRQVDQFISEYSKRYQVIRVSSILPGTGKEYFLEGDGHPTAKANEKIAETLVKELRSN